MKILFKNIKALVGAYENAPVKLCGADMDRLKVMENAWLAVEDGTILDFGSMQDWPGISDWRDLEVIDASGCFMLPTWCDSHTHIVYAANRSAEFEDRIKGLSYELIAARGGGILNSVAKLRNASEAELYDSAANRLKEVMLMGTGAIEIKSGYGLNLESELKMLRVIRKLGENFPIPVKSTFLGAHAVPIEFKNNREGYVDLIIREMLPAIHAENLADFIDVFCETNYFTTSDLERILEAGHKYGLIPKTHVNQFNAIGGVRTSIRYNALSVDHLEVITNEDLEELKNSQTMPVALPGCSLFIQIPYTPGRQIIDYGLPLALATDYNPGSAPSGNMNLAVSLACIQMKLTPSEAICAATLNAAYAMNISATHGSITPGKKANIMLTHEIDSLADIPYSFGKHCLKHIWIEGQKLV